MKRKPILSPTKLATYIECAVKYRYIYVDRIGRWYLKARPEFSFGSTLHRVIQSFYEEGGVRTAEELADKYEAVFMPAGYANRDERESARLQGAEIIQAYHDVARERESSFIEPLLIEKTIKLDMGKFYLSGRVDRIDRHPDGSLEIIDYKSGRRETSEEEVAADLAMNVYQLILRRQNPGIRVFSTIHCLRSGISASAEMSNADSEKFAGDIHALGEEILSRDFVNVEPVKIEACDYCEFFARCNHFWRWQARRDSISD